MPNKLVSQPIQRILLASFILVAVVPVIFLTLRLYQLAWENSWREINEKHLLLAQNLASPISVYITDHRNSLGLIANNIKQLVGDENEATAQIRLNEALTHIKGFRSLSLINPDGKILAYANEKPDLLTDAMLYSEEQSFIHTRTKHTWKLSGIKPSPMTGKPTLILTQPVYATNHTLSAVLLAELRIELIENLRRNIKFGEKGHAAIVDQYGHIIAHPNPDWMKEMRDLSKLSVVQKMMAGRTGVTEFYSPFVKEDMVVGYTSVPGLGWGVMVPQPKSEVSKHVNTLMWSHLISGIAGLVLAALFSLLLTRWITRPIKNLADASQKLIEEEFMGDIPRPENNLPREVHALSSALGHLVGGLQKSRKEISRLNTSLEARVVDATKKLRKANQQLEKLANMDHLTQLPNRRHFENTLSRTTYRRDCDKKSICILLIDVDDFKNINDDFGHAAGDKVLRHIAKILETSIRTGDLVARYGGDEFAVQMRCSKDSAKQKAWDIRESIRNEKIPWDNREIQITVSIGLSCLPYTEPVELDAIMRTADAAMYEAKNRGKNTVVDLQD